MLNPKSYVSILELIPNTITLHHWFADQQQPSKAKMSEKHLKLYRVVGKQSSRTKELMS